MARVPSIHQGVPLKVGPGDPTALPKAGLPRGLRALEAADGWPGGHPRRVWVLYCLNKPSGWMDGQGAIHPEGVPSRR